MVDQQPALGGLDRNRASADLRRLPGVRDRLHHVPVLAPVGEIGALAVEDLAKRRMAVVGGAREHGEVAVDLAREEHAVAVEGQEGVLILAERLEVLRPGDADRRAVVAVAPGHVVAILDPDDARVVAVNELGNLRLVALELDRLGIEVPVEPVAAEAAVHDHQARAIVAAENACKLALVRHDCAVEDAVRARDQVPRDDRVLRVTPDRLAATGGAILPGKIGNALLVQDLNASHALFPAATGFLVSASSAETRTRWSASYSTSTESSASGARISPTLS